MYDIIESIIAHSWESNYTSDQQYIYYVCCCLIVLFSVTFIDLIYRFVRGIIRKGDF